MTNRNVLGRVVIVGLSAVLCCGMAAQPAAAQSGSSSTKKVDNLEPPTPGQAKTDGIVWPMIMGIVVAGAALVVNLIPSKRGHQD